MSKTLEEMQKMLEKASADAAKFKLEAEQASKKFDEFSNSVEKEKAEAKKEKAAYARKMFSAMLEKAVKDNDITPAQRDSFSKLLKIDDDDSVLEIDIEDVKKLVFKSSKNDGAGKGTASNDDSEDGMSEESADVQLDLKVSKFKLANPDVDHFEAVKIVMAANPRLSEAYKFQNGTTTTIVDRNY